MRWGNIINSTGGELIILLIIVLFKIENASVNDALNNITIVNIDATDVI